MKKSKGVTIVGVLVGIMILSIALAAQIKLLSNTIRREGDMRNLIIASSLAREGVEIAFGWRINQGWAKLKAQINTVFCPDIRDTNTQLTDLRSNNSCSTATLNPVSYTGYYGNSYSNFKAYLYGIAKDNVFSTPSFSRTVTIVGCDDDPTNDICLQIKSKVGWANGKEVEISKKIYNWYVP